MDTSDWMALQLTIGRSQERISKLKKSDIFRKARDLIANQNHWTTGALAIDATGNPVWPDETGAVAWCAVGAMIYAAEGLSNEAEKLLNDVAYEIILKRNITTDEFLNSIAMVNDIGGHALVMEMYDRVIEKCEKEENNGNT